VFYQDLSILASKTSGAPAFIISSLAIFQAFSPPSLSGCQYKNPPKKVTQRAWH
jgi:hypothetical protein